MCWTDAITFHCQRRGCQGQPIRLELDTPCAGRGFCSYKHLVIEHTTWTSNCVRCQIRRVLLEQELEQNRREQRRVTREIERLREENNMLEQETAYWDRAHKASKKRMGGLNLLKGVLCNQPRNNLDLNRLIGWFLDLLDRDEDQRDVGKNRDGDDEDQEDGEQAQ
ncbi:unnamed protein product [Fusarium equiseti]|uniref:Uncharacterized protein n=1 Tax=Fusarium equiseti TaxID=61235 RepID=A0A8J2NNF3_FUSEQ|nr:unnamed protein product [Fusarium equiseti]